MLHARKTRLNKFMKLNCSNNQASEVQFSLIVLLRHASSRLREKKHQGSAQRMLSLSGATFIYPLMTFPVLGAVGSGFYLRKLNRPNTKAATLFKELKSCGIDEKNIYWQQNSDSMRGIYLIRFLLRAPWLAAFLFQIFRRSRHLDKHELQVLINYAFARRWLRKRPQIVPIIISDVSPELHAIWGAALKEGNRVLWWQDDFHHHRFLYYSATAAAVLNESALSAVISKGRNIAIVHRATATPLPFKCLPSDLRIGLATNVLFKPSDANKDLFHHIRKIFAVDRISLRLHPNSKLGKDEFSGLPIELADSNKSLENFSSRINLVFVGNSASQIWFVRNGVPVVHIAGLDDCGFDSYGYVQEGLIFGCEDLTKLTFSDVAHFYNDSRHRKIVDYTSVTRTSLVKPLSYLNNLIQPDA